MFRSYFSIIPSLSHPNSLLVGEGSQEDFFILMLCYNHLTSAMIGFLKGILFLRDDPYVVIDVHGVGYKVCASPDFLSKFHMGDTVTIFTHTHVREDTLELFGFVDQAHLELFELLISVNGIGPKTAIGIFGIGSKDQIIGAIRKADVDFFIGVPRLGKKNAQKIIIELKNKIGSVEELDLSGQEGIDEVVLALTSFGFSEAEAKAAMRQVGEDGKNVSEKVRLALKYLGK